MPLTDRRACATCISRSFLPESGVSASAIIASASPIATDASRTAAASCTAVSLLVALAPPPAAPFGLATSTAAAADDDDAPTAADDDAKSDVATSADVTALVLIAALHARLPACFGVSFVARVAVRTALVSALAAATSDAFAAATVLAAARGDEHRDSVWGGGGIDTGRVVEGSDRRSRTFGHSCGVELDSCGKGDVEAGDVGVCGDAVCGVIVVGGGGGNTSVGGAAASGAGAEWVALVGLELHPPVPLHQPSPEPNLAGAARVRELHRLSPSSSSPHSSFNVQVGRRLFLDLLPNIVCHKSGHDFFWRRLLPKSIGNAQSPQ